jgi:hypothetical protein
MAYQSLWIWHVYFGLFKCNNDLNVLDQSPLVANFLQDPRIDITFIVNGTIHQCFYLLINGIYLRWSIFVQVIHEPQGEKWQHFAKCQESV